jgi:hypothetical protein
VRLEPDLLERIVRRLQRGLVFRRVLRQHRVRDDFSKQQRMRWQRRRLRRLPCKPELHGWRGRLLVPGGESYLLQRGVHQHANGPQELRNVRPRLHDALARQRPGVV